MAVTRIQKAVANSAAATTATVSWPGATTDGNLLVAVIAPEGAAVTLTPPDPAWTLAVVGGSVASASPDAKIYYIENAAVRSGAESFLISASSAYAMELFEFAGVMWNSSLLAVIGAFSDTATTPISTGTTIALSDTTGFGIAALANASAGGVTQGSPTNSFVTIDTSDAGSGHVNLQTAQKLSALTAGGESTGATISTAKRWGASLAIFKGQSGTAPPSLTVAPAVTGTTNVSSTLSTTDGTWAGTPTSFAYQWQRDVFANGSYSNIASATSSTYALVDADWSCHVRCVVTASNAGGPTSRNSNVAGPIGHPVITRVQYVTNVGTTVSSIAATWGSTTTVGNLLTATVAYSQNAAQVVVTPPAGWTGLTLPPSYTSQVPGVRVFYILNSAARSGAETFTVTGAADATIGIREYSASAGYTWALSSHGSAFNGSASANPDSNFKVNAVPANLGNEVWVGAIVVRQQATTITAPGGGFNAISTLVTANGTPSSTILTQAEERMIVTPAALEITATLGTARQWATTYAAFVAQNPVPARAPMDVGLVTFSSGADNERLKTQAFMNRIGGYPKYLGTYRTWPQPLFFTGNATENLAYSLGMIPFMAWEPNVTCAGVVDGTHDTYLHTSAAQCVTFGKQVYIRPLYEFNGTWEPYGTSGQPAGNSYAQLITAFRYIVDLFASDGVTNVKWVWNPNINDGSGAGRYPFTSSYPGDAYVDIIALDGYNQDNPWYSPFQAYAQSYADITALSAKPLWLAEMGCHQTDTQNLKSDWYHQTLDQAFITAFPRIAAIHYFNDVGPNGDMTIDSSGTDSVAQAQFRSSMLSGNYSFQIPKTEKAGVGI